MARLRAWSSGLAFGYAGAFALSGFDLLEDFGVPFQLDARAADVAGDQVFSIRTIAASEGGDQQAVLAVRDAIRA